MLKRQQFFTGFTSAFSAACPTWSIQITFKYSVFYWSFHERYLFCFLVRWWSGLVRDRKCLDYFGRQLAKESENNFALLDQHLWSKQWTQPFALCEYVICFSLLLLIVEKLVVCLAAKMTKQKMWGRISSIKISNHIIVSPHILWPLNTMNKSNSVLLFELLWTSVSKFQYQFQLNSAFMEWAWERK